jgi:hypothetical protein
VHRPPGALRRTIAKKAAALEGEAIHAVSSLLRAA